MRSIASAKVRRRAGTSTTRRCVQAADDLYENSVVSDETWKQLSERFNTEQMMDAVFTVGQYNLVSWALNSFGVPLDDYLPGANKNA